MTTAVIDEFRKLSNPINVDSDDSLTRGGVNRLYSEIMSNIAVHLPLAKNLYNSIKIKTKSIELYREFYIGNNRNFRIQHILQK